MDFLSQPIWWILLLVGSILFATYCGLGRKGTANTVGMDKSSRLHWCRGRRLHSLGVASRAGYLCRSWHDRSLLGSFRRPNYGESRTCDTGSFHAQGSSE